MKAAREAIAFAFLPIALGAIVLLPPWVYLAMVWAITMLSARELLVLLRRLGQPAPLAPTLAALGVMLPVLWTVGLHKAGAVMALVLLVMPAVYLFGRYPIGGAAAAITGATFTALYFLVTGGAMGLLRTAFEGPTGTHAVLTHCLTIWGCDSGAYYLGSHFGRHRLAPSVSPKKSWEGILGGAALAAFGVWFCRTVFFGTLPVATAAGALRRRVRAGADRRPDRIGVQARRRGQGLLRSHPRPRRLPRPHRLAVLRGAVRARPVHSARGLGLKRLAVLGSTGSIGTATLDVAARFPERFRVVALAAGRNLASSGATDPRLPARDSSRSPRRPTPPSCGSASPASR